MNSIVENINSLSSPDPVSGINILQFTYIMFTDCVVVHFFLPTLYSISELL